MCCCLDLVVGENGGGSSGGERSRRGLLDGGVIRVFGVCVEFGFKEDFGWGVEFLIRELDFSGSGSLSWVT